MRENIARTASDICAFVFTVDGRLVKATLRPWSWVQLRLYLAARILYDKIVSGVLIFTEISMAYGGGFGRRAVCIALISGSVGWDGWGHFTRFMGAVSRRRFLIISILLALSADPGCSRLTQILAVEL
jgi:hypothetical protein